ncbi:17991_t:CDS:2, partial [Racocetra persica]
GWGDGELPTTYRSGGFSVPRQGYHLVSPKAQTEPFLPTSKYGSGEDSESEIEEKYIEWSEKTPYKKHPTAVTTSKMINTKEITTKLQEYYASGDLNLKLDSLSLAEVNIQEGQEQSSLQAQQLQEPK